jgi:eukaryotic-like serine/threonine-protein kinase
MNSDSSTGDHAGPLMPKSGDVIAGKYRIEELIGRGGMGAVYSAQHELLFQRVAVKVLLAEAVSTPQAVTRFLNEARAAAKIQNEHVARVMDVGISDNGHPYMVIEYLDGADLSAILEHRGKIPFTEAVDWVLQALEAIAQAHAFGIVHRDLKPSNLYLAERQNGSSIVKVLDFGISKSTNPFGSASDMALTSTKAMLGSPLYMSPEQLRSSKSVDARADIWALGVILHELIAGTVPFTGESLGELFVAILEQEPRSLREAAPDVPPALEQVVRHCLVRNVDHRFATVSELAQALAPFGSGRWASSVERIVATVGPRPQNRTPSASAFAIPQATPPSPSGSGPVLRASSSGPRQPLASTPGDMGRWTPQTGGPVVGAQTGQSFVTTAPEKKSSIAWIFALVAAVVVSTLVVGVLVSVGWSRTHRGDTAAALGSTATSAPVPSTLVPSTTGPSTPPSTTASSLVDTTAPAVVTVPASSAPTAGSATQPSTPGGRVPSHSTTSSTHTSTSKPPASAPTTPTAAPPSSARPPNYDPLSGGRR